MTKNMLKNKNVLAVLALAALAALLFLGFQSIPREKQVPVEAYFGNSVFDPDNTCTAVFPVERIVVVPADTDLEDSVLKIERALSELLSGVTIEEEGRGYFTSIPEGVEIQDISFKDGIARIDFSRALDEGVGGSCRVAAIRAQLRYSVEQFEEVDTVVISIEGRMEDILQP